MGIMGRNEKGRRREGGEKGRMGEGKKTGEEKERNWANRECVFVRWVYLDFASANASASRLASRGEVMPKPDNQVIGAFGYRGPRLELCAYVCRVTHISTRARVLRPQHVSKDFKFWRKHVITRACARARAQILIQIQQGARAIFSQGPSAKKFSVIYRMYQVRFRGDAAQSFYGPRILHEKGNILLLNEYITVTHFSVFWYKLFPKNEICRLFSSLYLKFILNEYLAIRW